MQIKTKHKNGISEIIKYKILGEIMQKVETGNTVKVHYTGKLEDGQVFDTSADREPLEFQIGKGQMIPGFEVGIMGMELKEKKTISIPSEQAYGPIKDELFFDIKKEQLPEGLEPKVGMELVSKHQDGSEAIVKVSELKDDLVTIDANHPLAGKDLVFDIEVVGIE